MGFIEALGSTIASLPGAALGLGLQSINDRRQIRQQEKLQNLQIQGQKQMMDYGYNKQLQMWQATSYPAQMEMMKKAGLNPGLMYGMGGGGGQTTGNAVGSVSGGNAPTGGVEIGMGMQLALQMKMMQSQIDKTEAEAENIKADTANKPKEGENLEASTNSIIQGIKNQKQQAMLTNALANIANVEAAAKFRTYDATVNYIELQTENAVEIVAQNGIKTNKDKATLSDEILQVKVNAIKTIVETGLIRMQTAATKTNIKLTEQQIINLKDYLHTQIQGRNKVEWDDENTKKMLELMGLQTEYNTDIGKDVIKGVTGGIGGILHMTPQPNVIRY